METATAAFAGWHRPASWLAWCKLTEGAGEADTWSVLLVAIG
jgi:hypothetical protein